MAQCPECGGNLWPMHLITRRFRDAVRCRWCRAHVRPVRWLCVLKNALLITAGTVLVTVLGVRYHLSAELVWLLAAAASAIAFGLVAWASECVIPIETVIPRDIPRWQRRPEE